MLKTSMLKTILSATVLAATLAGASLAATGTAEARYGRNGAFAAGAALGFLGGAVLASPGYGYGYGYAAPRPVYYGNCWWKRVWVEDGYGYGRVRKVRVCN